MTAQDLKNAILQLAVQGKLVPQDSNDEPASELLKRIKDEKERLIKAGTIKKDKVLAELTADDLPFDIPNTWQWTKLGYICQLLDGEKRSNEKRPYLEARFLRGKAEATILNEGKYVAKGTRLILVDGENSGEVFVATEDGYMGSTFKVLFFPQELFAGYLLFFLQLKQSAFRNNKTGSAIPHLNKDLFFNMPFPVPPLAEQQRIVAKIEELMPLVEEYGKDEERLTALNADFPDKLRKSILQQAIQGKLTERDPADEPASELLKRIRAEKEQLIKEGKIKKEKPLPPITEEEIQFEIPEVWEWVRWGDLSQSIQYGYNAPAQTKGRIRMVRISDIQNNNVLWDTVPYCDIPDEEIPMYLLAANDILFARTGGTVGKSFLVKEVPYESIYAGYLIRTRYSHYLVPEYLKYFMESQLYWDQLRDGTIATAQPNCNGKTLSKMLLPLPPFAEQQRIVDRVNELLAVCDELK